MYVCYLRVCGCTYLADAPSYVSYEEEDTCVSYEEEWIHIFSRCTFIHTHNHRCTHTKIDAYTQT